MIVQETDAGPALAQWHVGTVNGRPVDTVVAGLGGSAQVEGWNARHFWIAASSRSCVGDELVAELVVDEVSFRVNRKRTKTYQSLAE